METKRNTQKGVRNIIILGLISCFADISSEMVYPLIPLYLTAAFGATPVLVGVIEGIAESIASLLKVFSGYISDRFQHKKAIAFSGYATGVFYKIALIFAGSWAGILAARVIDRFGKGIRTAPRDVMVSESADKNSMGKSFGIHKMLDTSCGESYETQLRGVIENQPDVVCVDLLRTRMFGNKVYIDAEIQVDGDKSLREGHRVAEQVHECVEKQFPNVKHIMIHVNPTV